MKKRINRNNLDLRNTKEPYTILLHNKTVQNISLKRHIDQHTLTYKHWHLSSLKEISNKDGRIEFINSNGNICYTLTILVEPNKLYIICSCDRRVQKLCHHAYHALEHIADYFEPGYFSNRG